MAFTVPALKYAFTALEPHIDAKTMEIHHDKHHAAYVNNLNNALKGKADLEAKSIEQLIGKISSIPEDIRGAVRNNGGGHWNHSFFWNIINANKGGAPKGKVGEAIQAALPGKVVRSEDGFFYMGNSIVIQHGFGLYTLYAHMSRRNVREGEVVSSGQKIGEIGNSGRVTGPHLHWQAKLYGMDMDPKSLEVLKGVFK